MPLYTFSLCRTDGLSTTLVSRELTQDGDALEFAGRLLELHLSCDYVEIWDCDQPVISRYRFQPIIRSVDHRAHRPLIDPFISDGQKAAEVSP